MKGNCITEGIYRLDPSKYLYSRYAVVKKYGNEYRTKFQVSIEDCRQQVAEWDSDYIKKNPADREFIKGIVTPEIREKKARKRNKVNHYYVYLYGTDSLVAEGGCSELSERFRCVKATLFNASKDKGRRFRKLYEVTTKERIALA